MTHLGVIEPRPRDADHEPSASGDHHGEASCHVAGEVVLHPDRSRPPGPTACRRRQVVRRLLQLHGHCHRHAHPVNSLCAAPRRAVGYTWT